MRQFGVVPPVAQGPDACQLGALPLIAVVDSNSGGRCFAASVTADNRGQALVLIQYGIELVYRYGILPPFLSFQTFGEEKSQHGKTLAVVFNPSENTMFLEFFLFLRSTSAWPRHLCPQQSWRGHLHSSDASTGVSGQICLCARGLKKEPDLVT